MRLWFILEYKLQTHCTNCIWSEHTCFSGSFLLKPKPEYSYQHREMLSTFLILPTNLFLARWRFQPVEHRTLFKLQNNLTDGYLQTLQWANRNRVRDATSPLENWSKFVCANWRRKEEQKNVHEIKNRHGAPTFVMDHNGGAVAAQYKSPFTAPFPEVPMFACVAPDFSCGDYLFALTGVKHSDFPADWARIKQRGSVTDWDYTQFIFQWLTPKHSLKEEKPPGRLISSCESRALRVLAARYCGWRTAHVVCIMLLLSYCFLFSPCINIIVCLGIIMQSNLIFLFTMWLG